MKIRLHLFKLATGLLLLVAGDVFAALDTGSRLRTGVIAGGQNHTCALRSTGQVECWGSSNDSRLGNPTVVGGAPTPVSVQGL